MRMLSLWVLAGWLGGAASLVAQDDVRAVIARGIQALGGEERLARLPAEQVRLKGIIFLQGKPVPFTADMAVQLPSLYRSSLHYELDGKIGTLVQVLNGQQGWLSVNGQVQALNDTLLAEAHETLYANRLRRLVPLLRDQNLTLTPLGASKLGHGVVVGVKVSAQGHRDVCLFFDPNSGALVRTERTVLLAGPQKEVVQAELFADFRLVQGIRRPTRMTVLHDGQKFMEGELIEVRELDKLDPTLFAKP
jgi:hypothetical protein